jgi:hypothetical protein
MLAVMHRDHAAGARPIVPSDFTDSAFVTSRSQFVTLDLPDYVAAKVHPEAIGQTIHVMFDFVLDVCGSDCLIAHNTQMTFSVAGKNRLGEHHRQASIRDALTDAQT